MERCHLYLLSVKYLSLNFKNYALRACRRIFWTLPRNLSVRELFMQNVSSQILKGSWIRLWPILIQLVKCFTIYEQPGVYMRFHFEGNEIIVMSLSGQFLIIVYMIQPEMKLIEGVTLLRSFWWKWNFISGNKNLMCKHYWKWNYTKRKICKCDYFIKKTTTTTTRKANKKRWLAFIEKAVFLWLPSKPNNFISFCRQWKVM